VGTRDDTDSYQSQYKYKLSFWSLALDPRDLQVSGADSFRGHGEVLALQAALFQAQLELQDGQRAQRQAGRTQEDLSRALQRLEKDLQGALQHRRDTERHNQVRSV